ncbi:phosphopantetheine-binding protein, partial [Streptosporangium sp. NPDC048047]|uniref:AMP-binding enzyme n=1 Tax=Streptosporangium sp. NPDC048047 TaxID=3155748 RepID=UPI00342131CB
RGIRIELGEIENVLSRHPDVAQAVVLAREDRSGERRLVAYLVPRATDTETGAATETGGGSGTNAGPGTEPVSDTGSAPNAGSVPGEGSGERSVPGGGSEGFAARVRRFAEDNLPAYMIPAALTVMDTLPLNHSGKVDRHTLPAPTWQDTTTATAFVPPRTDAEHLITDVWTDVLDTTRIGVHDDFFALGGNSLLAIRVRSRIRSAVDLEIPINVIFANPTVEKLADAVEALLIADIEAGG